MVMDVLKLVLWYWICIMYVCLVMVCLIRYYFCMFFNRWNLFCKFLVKIVFVVCLVIVDRMGKIGIVWLLYIIYVDVIVIIDKVWMFIDVICVV